MRGKHLKIFSAVNVRRLMANETFPRDGAAKSTSSRSSVEPAWLSVSTDLPRLPKPAICAISRAVEATKVAEHDTNLRVIRSPVKNTSDRR